MTNNDAVQDKLSELRKLYGQLRENGFHGAAQDVAKKIVLLNHPQVGEVLYLDRNQESPVTVVSVSDENVRVGYIPGVYEVSWTHQGNLYGPIGTHPYDVRI